jgi:acyl carrier protein
MSNEIFTFEDLKEILVRRVGLPEDSIPNDPNKRLTDLGLDSLALVEIQLDIQQRYGLVVPDDDAAKIGTIGQAIEYTNHHLREKK